MPWLSARKPAPEPDPPPRGVEDCDLPRLSDGKIVMLALVVLLDERETDEVLADELWRRAVDGMYEEQGKKR